MGAAPTGVLTFDEYDQLSRASRNVDGDLIGMQPQKSVLMAKDGSWVSAEGTGAMEGIADPINFVRIMCEKETQSCEMYDANFDIDNHFLFLGFDTVYQIERWAPSRVTAKIDAFVRYRTNDNRDQD